MNDLLQLIESCSGVCSLTLYQQDGLCWQKRGELRITAALVNSLKDGVRAAAELQSVKFLSEPTPDEVYDCPIHGMGAGPDCPRC